MTITIRHAEPDGDAGAASLQTRLANIKNHGFDFLGCEVVLVVHTPRGEVDHVISKRKAENHEERIYWKNYPG